MKRIKAFSKIFLIKKFFLIPLLCLFTLSAFTTLAHAIPEASTALDQNRISLNEHFSLYLNITWHGDADEYMIEPPEPVFPEGISLISSSFSSSVSKDIQFIKYHYTLKADKKGSYTIPPFQIKYWDRRGGQESFIQANEITFEIVKFDFFNFNIIWIMSIAAVIMLAAIIIIAIIINRRVSKKKESLCERNVQNREYALIKIQECRECKLKGDYKGFYQAAIEISKKCFIEDNNFIDNLTDNLEKVQFGGSRPSSDEIERTFRHIDKKTNEFTSDKSDKELELQKYCQ
jgi:amino acid transporter